jgi:hypothetical protein
MAQAAIIQSTICVHFHRNNAILYRALLQLEEQITRTKRRNVHPDPHFTLRRAGKEGKKERKKERKKNRKKDKKRKERRKKKNRKERKERKK